MKTKEYYKDLIDTGYLDKLTLPCCCTIQGSNWCAYKKKKECIALSYFFNNTYEDDKEDISILITIEELINTQSKKLALLNLNSQCIGIQIASRYILQLDYCNYQITAAGIIYSPDSEYNGGQIKMSGQIRFL
jgi:hypothetical protein